MRKEDAYKNRNDAKSLDSRANHHRKAIYRYGAVTANLGPTAYFEIVFARVMRRLDTSLDGCVTLCRLAEWLSGSCRASAFLWSPRVLHASAARMER